MIHEKTWAHTRRRSCAQWALLAAAGLVSTACGKDDTDADTAPVSESDEDASGQEADVNPTEDGAGGDVEPPRVEVAAGLLEGVLDGELVAFRGVPYAAPPVGDLRWRAPQPAEAWEGPRDASEFGSICEQVPIGGTQAAGEEDCLYLNVYTPELAPATPAPVMVWIHGGAFVNGSGGEATYDGGRALVTEQGVVVVTLNYRLNAAGFLAHPALTAEGEGSSGNYGIMDQQMALRWVKDNIAAFGGDPDNVTLFGESAGSISVSIHMVAPDSRGLFHRAIMQSGTTTSVGVHENAEQVGLRIADAVGCSDMATAAECLRALPNQALRTALESAMPMPEKGGSIYQGPGYGSLAFGTVNDGSVLPKDLLSAEPAPVPVLMGSNQNEGVIFHHPLAGNLPVETEAEYREALARLPPFAGSVDEIVATYPPEDYGSPEAALVTVTGDAIFNCATRSTARAYAEAGLDVYLYAFQLPLADSLLFAADEAGHAGELPYLFDTPNQFLGGVPTQYEPQARALRDYWARFAATGDPNGDGAVAWPRYETSSDAHLAFADPIAADANYKQSQCDFWEEATRESEQFSQLGL